MKNQILVAIIGLLLSFVSMSFASSSLVPEQPDCCVRKEACCIKNSSCCLGNEAAKQKSVDHCCDQSSCTEASCESNKTCEETSCCGEAKNSANYKHPFSAKKAVCDMNSMSYSKKSCCN